MKNGNNFIRGLAISTAVIGIWGLLGCDKKADDKEAPPGKVKEIQTLYQCPMHHQIIREHPGACPICGMTLVAVQEGHDSAHSIVAFDPSVVQNMGVRTETVHMRSLAPAIRLEGKVAADESRIRSVTARVNGYVEKLQASLSGQTVREGEVLIKLYSPDLVSAQEELIQALNYREDLPASATASLRGNAEQLVESARRRLSNWGIAASFVDALEKTRQVVHDLPIVSPAGGIVARKNVIEGQSVMPGNELFQIVDLSQVWVTAHVYQRDLASVHTGSNALLRFGNLPGRELHATVFFVSPEMDPMTRTAEIRMRLSNTPAMDLRPEMFAEVSLQGEVRNVLAVPEQSVIHSGIREIAIVSLGGGRFMPREIHTGRTADGYTEILDGLSEGDEVVVSSQFLIDSESNLRTAIENMKSAGEEHDL
jgi:Cu(I)/Ag(I) efflux system membrane fusion protein